MDLIFKIIFSLIIILLATFIARKIRTLAGLIATMPLTALIVMILIHLDNQGNRKIMVDYTIGAVYGILPSMFFFVAAFYSFKKGFSLPLTLLASFGVWFVGAIIHQWALK